MKDHMNNRIQPLAIQKYVKMAQSKEIISFAAGLPDLSVLPTHQLGEAYQQIASLEPSTFQYQGPTDLLKKKVQKLMASQSLNCSLDEILITNGAQQAIYLTAQLFFKQQASLIIEEFVYPGFLQIANMFEMNYLAVISSLKHGIDLNHLESLLKTHKALPYFYMVCNGHNPLGISYSNEAKKNLAYLAEKYNFIIIEDDPYGFLNYTDEHYLPMRSFTNNAIYVGSFSKILAPALRTGWMIGDEEVIQKLHQLKDMNDLYCSNPNHLAINFLLDKYSLNEITTPQKRLYKEKLQCMLKALSNYLKIPYHYEIPKHGMFLWLEFPNSAIEEYHDALFAESKVLYIPASAFTIDATYQRPGIRLNFTYPSFEEIELGIKKLSLILNQWHKKLLVA